MNSNQNDLESRRMEHEGRTLSVNKVNLSRDVVDELFPHSVPEFQTHFQARIDGKLVCWLAIDMVPLQPQALLHVYILDHKRTRQNIEDLQVAFKKLMVPLLYDMGRRSIVVVTDGGEKVNALARSFGFDPQPCWISEMRIEKE